MVSHLISKLLNPGLKNGGVTLQEVLTEVTCESRNAPRVSQIWSTMFRKLDFPRCKDIYIPHRFKEPYLRYGSYTYSFELFMQALISCENQLVLVCAPPGMGKSRNSDELYSQLVLRMDSYCLVHQKLSQTISYWNEFDRHSLEKTPSVETFLKSCVDKRKERVLLEKLASEKVFVILDGFDEICPFFQEEATKMLDALINYNVHVLVTSRPQERDKIVKGLKSGTKVKTVELDGFKHDEKVLMLKTRLNISEAKGMSLLNTFDNRIHGFSNNPLHLQMICDIYTTDQQQLTNIFEIYNYFVNRKLKHGLITCRQVDEKSYEFKTKYRNIEKNLTKSAVSLILNNENIKSNIKGEDYMAINVSGVATIVEENGPIEYVHRSFAEFTVAKEILRLCFSYDDESSALNGIDVFCQELSWLIRKFIDNGLCQYCDQQINQSFACLVRNKFELVMSIICKEGLSEVYTHFIEKPFSETQVAEFWKDSQEKAFNSYDDEMGLFLKGCLHDNLAVKLAECCFTFKVRDVQKIVTILAKKHEGIVFEKLLCKVEGWQDTFSDKLVIGDLMSPVDSSFSLGQLDYFIKRCPNIVKNMYFVDFNRFTCRLDILPVLLKNGLELTVEKDKCMLADIFLRSNEDEGAIRLFKYASEVADHFNSSDDFDSEKSWNYMKNFRAKSPGELNLNCSEDSGKAKYLEHIFDRISLIFDNSVCCELKERRIVQTINSLRQESILHKENYFFKQLFLYALRNFDYADAALGDIQSMFLTLQQQIPRDFKFKCGCSLENTQFAKNNDKMMMLLVEKGFTRRLLNVTES